MGNENDKKGLSVFTKGAGNVKSISEAFSVLWRNPNVKKLMAIAIILIIAENLIKLLPGPLQIVAVIILVILGINYVRQQIRRQ